MSADVAIAASAGLLGAAIGAGITAFAAHQALVYKIRQERRWAISQFHIERMRELTVAATKLVMFASTHAGIKIEADHLQQFQKIFFQLHDHIGFLSKHGTVLAATNAFKNTLNAALLEILEEGKKADGRWPDRLLPGDTKASEAYAKLVGEINKALEAELSVVD